MKANAPEKIYLHKISEDTGELSRFWSYDIFDRQDVNNIEYTRTDAFIEKVIEFLKNNLDGYDLQEEDIDRIIEDFKVVMKL